jgi:hypothetical protein
LVLIRIQKECDAARGTHFLERLEVRTGHDIGRKRESKVHSLPGEGRGKDWSEYRKNVS